MLEKIDEVTAIHTRLLSCTLEVENARAYWMQPNRDTITSQQAFESYLFGAKSLARMRVLLGNMRARFGGGRGKGEWGEALGIWESEGGMSPEIRRLVCHWHLQLSDYLYRGFTGDFLVQRRAEGRAEVSQQPVVGWVGQQVGDRWTMSTRVQFASKLLSSAYSAGLLRSTRDPRPVLTPRVDDVALEYLMYLLRGLRFEGTLLANPYLASVCLDGPQLEVRLRGLPGLSFRRQGELVDFGWRYPNLVAWAQATFLLSSSPHSDLRVGGMG